MDGAGSARRGGTTDESISAADAAATAGVGDRGGTLGADALSIARGGSDGRTAEGCACVTAPDGVAPDGRTSAGGAAGLDAGATAAGSTSGGCGFGVSLEVGNVEAAAVRIGAGNGIDETESTGAGGAGGLTGAAGITRRDASDSAADTGADETNAACGLGMSAVGTGRSTRSTAGGDEDDSNVP